MEYFDLLFFLALPALVFSQNCITNDKEEHFGLDVNKTATVNTTAILISELSDWDDVETCITSCCNTYESEGCTIAEFNKENNACRLYKSNCKLSETCILEKKADKILTFVKKAELTTVSPKSSDNESKNATTSAIDSTNSIASGENLTESSNYSNATMNTTLLASNTLRENASVSNITNNRMENGTELKPSYSSSNTTAGFKSDLNSTNVSDNTTTEMPLQIVSNQTKSPSLDSPKASGMNGSNEILTAHITAVAPYISNATNITSVAPNANNATNITSDQYVNNTNNTPSVTTYVNNATNETEAVLKPTSAPSNHISNVQQPSEKFTKSSNSVQNKTNVVSAKPMANTTTSTAPKSENNTEISSKNNITTTLFAANPTNSSATDKKANHELLPQRTNETTKQSNVTIQSSSNVTSNRLNITEKTTKMPLGTAEANTTGVSGFLLTTKSPAFNMNKTTTIKNNITVSNKSESVSNTTLAHGMTQIPVTNTTKVLTSKDILSELNATITKSNHEAETTTQTIQPKVRFHYPHFETPESAAMSGALIAAVSFGIIFLFSVLVLVGKRCFDSWQRRHYSRMDFLVNGMYN